VAVVILDRSGGSYADAWGAGIDRLAARLGEEKERWRGPGPAPFRLELVAHIPWAGDLPLGPDAPGPGDRLRHWLALRRFEREVRDAAGLDPSDWDLRAYVLVEPDAPGGPAALAEGRGALRGEVAMVRVAGDPALDLPLVALGHELLHCAGAVDAYGPDGHALEPEGLADPGLSPRHPQRHAEWMAGELPLAPGRGRLPSSLAEVRVGPATAGAVGWILDAGGAPSR
jgi:hypothetical protein